MDEFMELFLALNVDARRICGDEENEEFEEFADFDDYGYYDEEEIDDEYERPDYDGDYDEEE